MTIKQEQNRGLNDKDFASNEFLDSQKSFSGIDFYQFVGYETEILDEKTETNELLGAVAPQTDTVMAHEAEKTSTVSNTDTSATPDTTYESAIYTRYSYASFTEMSAPHIAFCTILPATSDTALTNGQTDPRTDNIAPADSSRDPLAIGTDSTVDDISAVNTDSVSSERATTNTDAPSDSLTGSADYAIYTTQAEPIVAICPIMILPPLVIQVTDPLVTTDTRTADGQNAIDANASTDTSIDPVDSNLGAPIDSNSDIIEGDAIDSDTQFADNSDSEASPDDTSGSDISSVDIFEPVVCPIFGDYLPIFDPWYYFEIDNPIDSAVDPIPWIWHPVHVDPFPWVWNPEVTQIDTDMGSILLSDNTTVIASDDTQATDNSSPEANLETKGNTNTDLVETDNQTNTTKPDVTVDYIAEPITYPISDYYPMPFIEPWYCSGGVISCGEDYRSDAIVLVSADVQAPDLTLLGAPDIQVQML